MSKRAAKGKSVSFEHPFNGGKISVSFNSASEEPVEIRIYEDIGEDPWGGGGMTAEDFATALDEVPRNRAIDLRINSAGGSVWDGQAIFTRLQQWPGRKTACIDGMAASVASWLPMACDEIRAPKHAQMFIHPAWGICMGNAEDMRGQAEDLDKTTDQIADIYARKTGMSLAECRNLMEQETLMTAEEALKMGFIDKLTDEDPVANFSQEQLNSMRAKLAILNSLTAPQGGAQPKDQMNRNHMIALLNKWGVTFEKDATDEALMNLVEKGKPGSAPRNDPAPGPVKYKPGSTTEHASDCNCASCMSSKNAPNVNPSPGAKPDHEPPGKGGESELFKAAEHNSKRAVELSEKAVKMARGQVRNALKAQYNIRLVKLVEDDKLPAAQLDGWLNDALNAWEKAEEAGEKEAEKFADAILNRLEALPARPPGIAPLNIAYGDTDSVEGLNRFVKNMMEPQDYFMRNRLRPNLLERNIIGDNAKAVSQKINSMRRYDPEDKQQLNLKGPLREMWDAWAASPEDRIRIGRGQRDDSQFSPRNANTMASGLLRQVILSEVMRAFRRRLVSLTFFAHTFQSVPLEGTDIVQVPYYPLDTIASSDFSQSAGYQITPGAQTLSKSITVGGVGGAKSAGIGRKYKGLQFSAYEIRRQPWLDIQKLTVMAGEQLALDVLNDIIAAWINQTNFGNAVFSGPAAAFNANVVGQKLQVAANQADWPEPSRNLVLDSVYYGSLVTDPDVKAFLSYGDIGPIREAHLAGLYGFENTVQNPRIPQTGDAALVGWMSWPSAILVATAPIMPAPGEMLRLVTAEMAVDDQTGLAFVYKYWGDPMFSTDYEIIECTYGSGLGELAALKRLVSSGV